MTNLTTAGRFLQCMSVGKNNAHVAKSFAESQGQWSDRSQLVNVFKSITEATDTDDYHSAYVPVAESFLGAMRSFSVPMRLANLKRVPMLTRLYLNSAGITSVRVAEGAAVPVMRGTWATETLRPLKHAGIIVQTNELVRSASHLAMTALTSDLAESTAEAENLSFVSPDQAGSALYGAPHFTGSGASLTNVDADLKRLVDLVPGASRPGAAFVMTKESATVLSLMRGTGGQSAYPLVTPQGGELIGLPVLITSACTLAGSPTTRIIGLLDPSRIFWADDGKITLSTSTEGLIEMDGDPSADSLSGTPANTVSMFQTNSTALMAVRESSWHATAGSGAYFTTGF
jgi:HK97 family phage major capsid protein